MRSWGWSPHNRISFLIRKGRYIRASSLCHVRVWQKGRGLQVRKKAPAKKWICWYFDLRRDSFQNWRNKCLLFQPPSLCYFVIVAWANEDLALLLGRSLLRSPLVPKFQSHASRLFALSHGVPAKVLNNILWHNSLLSNFMPFSLILHPCMFSGLSLALLPRCWSFFLECIRFLLLAGPALLQLGYAVIWS